MRLQKILPVFSLLGLTACFNLGPQKSNTSGYVSRPNDRWQSSTISTCFEQDGYDLEKVTVASAVSSEFKKAGVDFTGWEKCTESGADIRVQFENNESGSRVQDFGNHLKGLQQGIILGLAHECLAEYSGSHCQENVALHEFGHAVGLHHEMNRRDNVECAYEQTMEMGESEATQIGDFDPKSIMNYCNDFTANVKNEFLGLSEGDIATIRARYQKPTADLSGFIPATIKTKDQFKGKVEGYRVSEYRYRIGIQSELDCKDSAGYSETTPITTEIPADILDPLPKNRTLRLCLVGGDGKGEWQDFAQYTSIDFVQLAETKAKAVVQSIKLVPYNASYLRVDVQLGEPMPDGTLRCDLQYENNEYSRVSCDDKAIKSADEKTLSALVPRRYLQKNGLTFLSSIMIMSDSHETVWYSAGRAGEKLKPVFSSEEVGLESAQYLIEDGLKDDGKVPVLKGIKVIPAKSPESPQIYFEVKVDEGKPSSLSLDFALQGTDKVFSGYSGDFFQIGPNTWRFGVAKSNFVYQGTYRLKRVQIYEFFSHNYELDVAPDSIVVEQTQSPVPELTIDRGFPIDTEPFKLLSIETEGDATSTFGTIKVKLNFDSKIPISTVYATFENTLLGMYSEMWLSTGFSQEPGSTQELIGFAGFDTLNGTYRLKTLEITDIGNNKMRADIKSDDLVIPGTQVPVPHYEVTKGKDFEGPNLVSLSLDKTHYKKGETLSLIARTKPGKGMTNAFVEIQGTAAGSREISQDFETAGDETTSLNMVLDDRFPAGEYYISRFQALNDGRDDIYFWTFGSDEETYYMSRLKVIRFTVE